MNKATFQTQILTVKFVIMVHCAEQNFLVSAKTALTPYSAACLYA